VTKATPRVANDHRERRDGANAPTIALRQLTVIPATRTSVNASTNSTAAARNAAITIAHCIYFFSYSLCRGLHQALPIGNDVCVISILQFLKEALYLWNVHHIPPGADPHIGATSRVRRSISYKVKKGIYPVKTTCSSASLSGTDIALPHSKAHRAGLRATTQVTRFVLSRTIIKKEAS
jgi:hypothetical protein